METQNITESFEMYKLKMDNNVSELDSKIESLKTKAIEAHAEQKQQYHQMLDDLTSKRDQMKDKLKELENNSGSAYEEMKAGMEKAWTELSLAFDKATSSF